KALYRSQAIACAGQKPYASRHREEWLAKFIDSGLQRRAGCPTHSRFSNEWVRGGGQLIAQDHSLRCTFAASSPNLQGQQF
ncbi:MAG: hypothetical protein WA655_00310, partial [Candidatus Korobacteraceae bacterium]